MEPPPVLGETSAAVSAAGSIASMELAPGPRRAAILLLLLIYSLNFLDRQVVNILAEPIKHDLELADWQIGVMTGFAFAVFYTIFGIPLARLAEHKSRPMIITGAIACWSTFTVLCGTAQNYAQLLAYRVGVGIGEAGCTPPAHSLIADYTPPEKRSSAMAFYHMGVPLGVLAGLAMGGIVADHFGWRVAFMVAGAPGLLVAILAALFLPEPRKRISHVAGAATSSLGETLRFLASRRSFRFLSAGTALKAFIAYGQTPFMASFFYRVHGPELAEVAKTFGLKSGGFLGLALGLSFGLTGLLGAWLGGYLGDRMGRRDAAAYGAIPAVAGLLALPMTVCALVSPSVATAFGFLVVAGVLNNVWSGPTHAAILGLPPGHMRATTSSILLLIINGVGLGLGPVAVGALSDLLGGPGGLGSAEGVRWALIAASSLSLVMAALYWASRPHLRRELPLG